MIANSIRLLESAPETTIGKDCAASSTHLLSTSLRVLSWNVARSNHSKTWARDWMAIVEQHQPDLIFMQEVRLSTQKQEIPQLAEMGWQFAPNFINTFDRSYSGVLIAARINCFHSKALLTQHQEPVVNTPKVSLFAKYSLSDSLSKSPTKLNDSASLLAVNVHAINFVNLDKFIAQLQAIELAVLQHQGAVVLAGDFNTWNQARWEALSQMAGRLDLLAVAFPREDQKNLKRFLNSPPLDYIFYRGFSQKPSSARVIDTPTSSDHNPLLVELCGG